jgi:hypothetical protein
MVAQADIVGNMGVDHEKIVRTDDSGFAGLGGTMRGEPFAKKIMVADFQPGRLVLVLYVLRRLADDATGVKAVPLSDDSLAGEIDVRPDAAVRSNNHIAVNYSVGADLDGGIQLGLGMDDGSGMDHEMAAGKFPLPPPRRATGPGRARTSIAPPDRRSW